MFIPAPLPDVPVHVMKAPCIAAQKCNGAHAVCICREPGEVAEIGHVLAEAIHGPPTCSRCVKPFSFGGEPVAIGRPVPCDIVVLKRVRKAELLNFRKTIAKGDGVKPGEPGCR